MLVFLFVSCFLTSCGLQECVVPDGGSKISPSCKTMNNFCKDASSIPSNTAVTVLSGTYRLNTTCEMKNASNITLRGQNGKVVLIECSGEENGFRFLNVSMLKISGIEFTGCGATWSPNTESAALLFIKGSNLTLTNITVSDAKYTGIYISNVAGSVTVDSCKVGNASAHKSGCGNVVVNSSRETSLAIKNSVFIRGRSNCLAGGLTLVLENSKITVDVINTNLTQNRGHSGGNMAVYFHDSASVTISNSTFNEGKSHRGGGVYVQIHFNIDNYSTNKLVILSIINSTVSKNMGEYYGGGAFIEWYLQTPLIKGNAYIDMINTSFDGNIIGTAISGGLAVDLQENPYLAGPYTYNSFVKNFHVKVNLSGCDLSNHNGAQQITSFYSVISANKVSYFRIDGITVKSNNCTAIMATGSKVVFSGSSRISNNTAVTGAGLQLVNTFISMTPSTDLTVTNNSAQQTGGGVKIFNYPGCIPNENCIYLPSSENVNFTISGNHALAGGDNVFGSGFCQFHGDGEPGVIIPPNTVNEPSSISSNPQGVCFGAYEESKCNNSKSVQVYPGEKVIIFIRLVGQAFGSIPGTVSASTVGVSIDDTERAQEVGISGKNISYTLSSSTAFSNIIKAYLNLQPIKSGCDPNYLDMVNAQIEISFSDCPFGFNIVNSSTRGFACQCTPKSAISSCLIDSQIIIKKRYSWVGMIQTHNHSYLATNDYCPLDYCNSTLQNITSYPDHLDQDKQCQFNRTGILCGSCRNGTSLVLGSSECREECSNEWLLLTLPFALAGLLLVVFIHFLNLTVTMGTVCGLIFYANIIQDYSTVLLSREPIPGLTPVLQIFLSWLNLDLGISTCFYNGMEAFGKTMLLFVFPIYIWLISATIIILSNRYIFFTRLFGETSVKVLSTLILLSYSKMFRVTIGALNLKFVNIYIDSSTTIEARWALDGNVPYFDPQRHLALFVIAILFMILLLPFSMSLLCIRHIYSLSNCCRIFSWVNRLKPFFDTYTGPFKDKSRFWVGLLLFVRLFLLIVHALDYKDNVVPYYIIIAVCLLLSSIMISLHGVYKRKCLNILEHFFIVNICILFLINTHKGGSDSWKSILSHLLVSSAFLVFLGIVVYHSYLKISHLGLLRKLHLRFRPQNTDTDYETLSCEGMRGYEPFEQDLEIIAH